MTADNVLRKVRGLLKLGESDNANESAAAIALAQRLMAEHSINEAMLELDGSSAEPQEEMRDWESPLGSAGPTWKGRLAITLAHANGCQAYRSGGHFKLIGRASQAEKVRYLFAYCEREVDRLAATQRGNGRSWINNYRLGCVMGIKDAIQTETARMRSDLREKARAGQMALVPLENAIVKVEQETRDAVSFGRSHLNLVSRSVGRSQYNPNARSVGREAGRSVYPGSAGGSIGAGHKRIGS